MKDNKSVFFYLALLGQLGTTVVLCILAGIWIYKIIERFFGQNFVIFLILVLFGIIAGFTAAYKTIMDITKK